MRVLITGGAGFIGSNFVRRVCDGSLTQINEIVVLDNLTYAGVAGNLHNLGEKCKFSFVQGDIRDSKLVKQLVSSVDAIINFAAESHVDRSILSAESFISTNVVGVQVILDAILATGLKQRLLQISTDEVYGSIENGSWDESRPLLPNSPYSASKAGAELLIRAYHQTHGVDTVITRSSNNYGPYHFPEKLIPLFITNLLQGKQVPIYGKGDNVRDWLHVDDHCRGIHKALLRGVSGEIYNIGGGRELTNLEITQLILQEMGMPESLIKYVEDRKGHDFRYSVNWKKANTQLDYKPQVEFEAGLRDTIDWYRQNENWWKPLKDRVGI